jgi:dTDP-4-dehydrorhamnose 3,5-epimerase-like enzyme
MGINSIYAERIININKVCNSQIMKTKVNQKFITKNSNDKENGYLIPIYNIHEKFHDEDKVPQQVYLTVAKPGEIKGPHLHYIRTGFFTCIKGNVRIIIKENEQYKCFYSGDNYNYMSIIVPIGIPAVIQNIGDDDAFILNMPSPAWTPEMNDEYTADFSDFNYEII